MSYKEIIKIFEERRDKMKTILLDNSNTMDFSKQHQIFGAINEIDVFLQTLKDYSDKQNYESASLPLNFYNGDKTINKEDK